MTRRHMREQIFLMLFQSEFHDMCDMDEQLAIYFENLEQPENEEDCEYLKKRYTDISARLGEIDMIIADAATGWRLNRMGKVDLTLLRLAVYEIRFDEGTPDKVAVNEAVELAKSYGGDSSAGFINGVLAKVLQ